MGKKAEKEAREAKEAAKRAEKEAKKAALKAKRDAKKGVKKAAAAAEKSAEAPESVELNAHNWTDEEQTLLNQGLAECPASMDKKERWKAIAAVVGTRSMKECAMRYKEVKENIIRKKTAEEARRRALSEQMGEAANAAAAEAYQASLAAAQADLANAGDEVDDMFEGMGGAVSRADDGAAADRLTEQGVVTTYAAGAKPHRNSKDISVSNLSVSFHGHPIIEGCELQLNWGNRYGFIGRNGSGKSTIMRVIGARAIPVPERIDIYHLTTEYPPTEQTALEAVMAVDEERLRVEKEIDVLNDLLATASGAGGGIEEEESSGSSGGAVPGSEADIGNIDELTEALNDAYERLEELDADTAETRATLILTGLGFSKQRQGMMTKDFSGGWRMRVALARALFIQPELLLLDEPTNHLDMEAVVWLEEYLSKWNKMLFMVCHSQDFLNNVCTHIVHLETHTKQLKYYRGNYDSFVDTRRDANIEQMKRYEAEQADIAAMKEYVARFGHGTASNARQGKSKEKLLNKKLAEGLTEKPVEEKMLQFKFPDPGHIPPPVLQVNSLCFGYPGQPALYTDVDFGLDLDARIALVGPNGAGKSTLVKIINGELVPRSGAVRPHSHLKMAKFTQHFEDILDMSKTPLEWFMDLYPNLTRDDARKWLGRYGTSGGPQLQRMALLSEGQKAKVVFAKMAKENAHLLLLDEPTNALDMEMIDSLAQALKAFKGGVLLVSHDMRLISQVANEIWIVDHGLTKYQGDIGDFKMTLRRQMNLEEEKIKAERKAQTARAKKQKASAAATTSEQLSTAKLPPPPPSTSSSGSVGGGLATASGGGGGGGAPPRAAYVPPHLRYAQQQANAQQPKKSDAW